MSGPLSEQQLAEIRAREAAATEGPWEPHPDYGPTFYGYLRGEYLRGVGDIAFGVGEQAEADLAFVLGAREDVPALLAEVERLTMQVTAVRAFAVSREYRWLLELLDGHAEGEAAAPTVWLATYEESAPETLGRYTTRAAAMDHIHAEIAAEENTTPAAVEARVIWRAVNPDAKESGWDCWLHDKDGGDDRDTGYSVAPVTVATAYTPPQPQPDVLPEAGGDRG